MLYLALSALIGLSSGKVISPETQARINDDLVASPACSSSQTNCHTVDEAEDYMTASVELIATDFSDSGCCYTYKLIHQLNKVICSGGGSSALNPELSHLDMDYICVRDGLSLSGYVTQDGTRVTVYDKDGNPIVDGDVPTFASPDGSTCYSGIKWDVPIVKDDGDQDDQYVYHYHVCMTWTGFSSDECAVADSWYMIKASDKFDFEELAVCDPDGPDAPCPEVDQGVPACGDPPPVTPNTCEEWAETAGNLSRDHVCECVTGVASDCGDDSSNYFCKSIGFVIDRLGDTAPDTDLCPQGGVCCCHCPVCSRTQ